MTDSGLKQDSRDRRYSFGEFVFDAHRGELGCNGVQIELNPQPARLLETLLSRAPNVVARDALQSELWGGKATVEFEQSLNTCIGQLRSALGETAKNPVYIKTEPKIGYRFLAPVEKLRGETSRRLNNSIVAAGIGAVFALFAAYKVFYLQPQPFLIQTDDSQIRELVLQARSLRKFGDASAMSESLALFERALKHAPDEPAAAAGAALNLAVLAGREGYPVAATYSRALDLAAQALAANGQAVDAILARGFIALYDRWDIAAARRDFERARSLAPNYALAHVWLAAALAADGDIAGSVAAASTAAELDPVSWYVHADRCWYLIFQEDFQNAVDVCAGAVEREPEMLWSQLGLIEAYSGAGRYADAVVLFDGFTQRAGLAPADAAAADAREEFYSTVCRLADAFANSKASVPNYLVAALYAVCGKFEAATPWLQNAVSGGESFVLFYHTDPWFAAYRKSTAAIAVQISIRKKKSDSTG